MSASSIGALKNTFLSSPGIKKRDSQETILSADKTYNNDAQC